MAGIADRFQVPRIQPQRIVEANEAPDVMHLRCRGDPASSPALLAQRIGRQMVEP